MTGPSFELPDTSPPKPRVFVGWIVLGLLFAFLVFTQLANYLIRSPEPSVSFDFEEEMLRSAVYNAEMSRRFSSAASPGALPGNKNDSESKAAEKSQKETFDLLDMAASRLSRFVAKEPSAALLLAVIRTEQHKEVPRSSMETLSKSRDEQYRTAAKLYASDRLSPEDAKNLVSKISRSEFVWRMARIQALEKAGDTEVRKRLIPNSRIAAFGFFNMANFLLLAAGGVLLVGYAIARRNGKWQPLGHPIGKLSFEQGDRFALLVAQILLLFALSGLLVVGIGRSFLNQAGMTFWSSILVLIGTFIILRGSFNGFDGVKDAFGLRGKKYFEYFAWSLGGIAVNRPLLEITSVLSFWLFQNLPPPEHPLSKEFSSGRNDALSWGAFFVSAAILAPIFEEVCFRGLLLPALESLLGTPFRAIVVSSLLFAAIHPTGIPAWLPLATVGAVAAMLTYQTRSLVPAILLHMMHNGLLVLTQLGLR